MKAFLIDPEARTITEVDHDDTLDSIYKHLDCHLMDLVVLNPERDVVYIDDEGLYNARHFFTFKNRADYPLAGRGLVLGTSNTGDSIEPQGLTLETLLEEVEFLELRDAVTMLQAEDERRRQAIAESQIDNVIFMPAADIVKDRTYTDESE